MKTSAIIFAIIRTIIRDLGIFALFFVALAGEKHPREALISFLVIFPSVLFCMYIDHLEEVRERNNKKWREYKRK